MNATVIPRTTVRIPTKFLFLACLYNILSICYLISEKIISFYTFRSVYKPTSLALWHHQRPVTLEPSALNQTRPSEGVDMLNLLCYVPFLLVPPPLSHAPTTPTNQPKLSLTNDPLEINQLWTDEPPTITPHHFLRGPNQTTPPPLWLSFSARISPY